MAASLSRGGSARLSSGLEHALRLGADLFTMSSVGGLGAAAVGSWLVGRHGFGSLGVLTAGVAATGALFAVIASRARRR